MKLPIPIILAAAFAAIPFSAITRADQSPVSIRVEQEQKSEVNKFTKTQHRTLKITLTNTGPDSLNLQLSYVFFGHEGKSHDVVVVAHSDMTTTLQPKSEQTLTTSDTKESFTEEHIENKKKVEASGKRITGYGVKVFEGAKVVAEACDPSSMQDDMSKVPNPPPPKSAQPPPKKKK